MAAPHHPAVVHRRIHRADLHRAGRTGQGRMRDLRRVGDTAVRQQRPAARRTVAQRQGDARAVRHRLLQHLPDHRRHKYAGAVRAQPFDPMAVPDGDMGGGARRHGDAYRMAASAELGVHRRVRGAGAGAGHTASGAVDRARGGSGGDRADCVRRGRLHCGRHMLRDPQTQSDSGLVRVSRGVSHGHGHRVHLPRGGHTQVRGATGTAGAGRNGRKL